MRKQGGLSLDSPGSQKVAWAVGSRRGVVKEKKEEEEGEEGEDEKERREKRERRRRRKGEEREILREGKKERDRERPGRAWGDTWMRL